MEQSKFERAKKIEKEIESITQFVLPFREDIFKDTIIKVETRNGSSTSLHKSNCPEVLKEFFETQTDVLREMILSKAQKEINKLEKEFNSL